MQDRPALDEAHLLFDDARALKATVSTFARTG
jgi:hypothetical protein